jgi:hypothetical protein
MKLAEMSLLSIALAGTANAGMIATYTNAEGKVGLKIECGNDGDGRLDMASMPGYFLIHRNIDYMVYPTANGPIVAAVNDLVTRMKETDVKAAGPSMVKGELIARGTAKVGPYSGVAYYLKTANGISPYPPVIVSDDPKLRCVGHILTREMAFSSRTTEITGQAPSPLMKKMFVVMAGKTPLRFAGNMLTALSHTASEGPALALPATPLTLDQLRKRQVPQ